MDEMSGIAQAFNQYYEKWTTNAMREQPDAFVLETKRLFSVLGRRIERENSELYPLMDNLT